jgi:hypothetical protein
VQIQWLTSEKIILQWQIATSKEVVWDGRSCAQDFYELVNHNFNFWNHLQSPPELTVNHDRVHAVEVEVTQQKRNLTSLPSRERTTVMITIVIKTKEITTTQVEQHNISKLITYMTNKALILYT